MEEGDRRMRKRRGNFRMDGGRETEGWKDDGKRKGTIGGILKTEGGRGMGG
jgi:hypothetical protein